MNRLLFGDNLDWLRSACHPERVYLEVSKSATDAREKVYVTIKELDWNPVVALWGRNSLQAATIVVTGNVAEAIPELREKIADYLEVIFER